MYDLTNVGCESETLDALVLWTPLHRNSFALRNSANDGGGGGGGGVGDGNGGGVNGASYSFPTAVHRLCDRFLSPASPPLAAFSSYPASSHPSSSQSRVSEATKRQKRAAFKVILDHRLTVPSQTFATKTFIRGAFFNSFLRSCDVVVDSAPNIGYGGGVKERVAPPPHPGDGAKTQTSLSKGLDASLGGVSENGEGDAGGGKAERLAALFEELDRRYALLDDKRQSGSGRETKEVEKVDDYPNDDDKENDGKKNRPSAATIAKTLHLLALVRRKDEQVGAGVAAASSRAGIGSVNRTLEVLPYQIEFSATSPTPFHRHFNVDIWLHERDRGRKWPSTTITFG